MATPLTATTRWSQAGKAGDGSDEFPLAATIKTPREAAYSREFLTPLSLAPYLPKLMLITSTPPSVRATIPSVTAAMPMRLGLSTLGAEITFKEACGQGLGKSEWVVSNEAINCPWVGCSSCFLPPTFGTWGGSSQGGPK